MHPSVNTLCMTNTIAEHEQALRMRLPPHPRASLKLLPAALIRFSLLGATVLGIALTRVPVVSSAEPAERQLPEHARQRTDHFPAFSWDRVPRYVHLHKQTAFPAEEIEQLARFPLITLEKTTGSQEFGSTEAGTLTAARAIKAVNPHTKVLYYRNVIVHYETYASNESLMKIPNRFLRDSHGNEALVRDRLPAYDLTRPAVRQWWVSHAQAVCAETAVDGLFLDGNVKVLEPGYLRNAIGTEKKSQLMHSYDQLVKETRQSLAPEKIMIANLLRARFPDAGMAKLEPFDGSYLEAFETTVGTFSYQDYVAKGIEAFQTAARAGYLIAFTAGLGAELDTQTNHSRRTDEIRGKVTDEQELQRRLEYLLAIFLVCAEEYSYFNAHEGYSAESSQIWRTSRAEFERPLGAPQGPAIRRGYQYTRRFAHAEVWLDLETQTGSVRAIAP